ncbi:uncharacterized protein VTP21DRAFT_4430 [Calcarisporiella thermophila]|uniref:uncharacterized protein n=1 Tax=Calcarisporiella thermophila TaxID=911321 RepID=UPI003742DBDF
MIVPRPSQPNFLHHPYQHASSIDHSKLVITPADEVMARAAVNIRVSSEVDVMDAPLEVAFDWTALAKEMGEDVEGEWFVVAFRSIRRADADSEKLYDADARAHEEAKNSGGLLKYWYASLNERRQCLAMCIWANREWARLANRKPYHIAAARLASKMYETYSLSRYRLSKKAGESSFTLEKM